MKKRYISKSILNDAILTIYEIIDTKINYSFLVADEKTTIDTIVNLLNKQDEEIKKNEYALRGFIRNCGTAECDLKINKAIEVLKEVRDFNRKLDFVSQEIEDYINITIAELRGGENDN